MANKLGEGDLLECSFCGKSQKQVKKLIAGPGVYICDACADLCNEIIEEELSEPTEPPLDELPRPLFFRAVPIAMLGYALWLLTRLTKAVESIET